MDSDLPPSRVAGLTLRADARSNKARVLDGARRAFADLGFDASYHDIARIANVGVGTVYRRYPEREVLLEEVLLDLLQDLTKQAERAMVGADPWRSFVKFFKEFSTAVQQHAGLSARIGDRGGQRVRQARDHFLSSFRQLHSRAREGGLRADVGWQDLLFLAQVVAADVCALDVEVGAKHRNRALIVILDGLKA